MNVLIKQIVSTRNYVHSTLLFIGYLFKELEYSNEIVKANNIKALITFGKFNKSDFIELLINQSLPFDM